MTLLRILLVVLLAAVVSAAEAAPAPLPRPNRDAKTAAYERLKQELSGRGYQVEYVRVWETNLWLIALENKRYGEPEHRRRRFYWVKAPHRIAALRGLSDVLTAMERE
jgi:hypothetical protein